MVAHPAVRKVPVFGFKRTWVTRVTGFWHNPGLQMTKTELQTALAEATRPTKEPLEYSWNVSVARRTSVSAGVKVVDSWL